MIHSFIIHLFLCLSIFCFVFLGIDIILNITIQSAFMTFIGICGLIGLALCILTVNFPKQAERLVIRIMGDK